MLLSFRALRKYPAREGKAVAEGVGAGTLCLPFKEASLSLPHVWASVRLVKRKPVIQVDLKDVIHFRDTKASVGQSGTGAS